MVAHDCCRPESTKAYVLVIGQKNEQVGLSMTGQHARYLVTIRSKCIRDEDSIQIVGDDQDTLIIIVLCFGVIINAHASVMSVVKCVYVCVCSGFH